ncbi:MAG: NADH-quinone oxidoreductase subunit H [Desulfobacterales bacterium]|nr:NADH-quinone oxidoreductase subunit H [Desulfobacterales bacterium]
MTYWSHQSISPVISAIFLAPLLFGVINWIKAFLSGRRGAPWLQPYFDLWKLMRKSAVYSRTTTWIFRAGPLVGLGAILTAAMIMPMGNIPALVSFPGDFVLFAYLLALGRFFTIIAALDTGSSFQGMGASREAYFSALSEPALLLALTAVARRTGSNSLSGMYEVLSSGSWALVSPAMVLVFIAIFIVFLTENARIPVDDPTTHLELTMIHEVMVLDHGGPDLAFINYGAALKMWILGQLLIGIVNPVHTGIMWLNQTISIVVSLSGPAIAVGLIEFSMARLRLKRVPQLLVAAGIFSVLALIMELR